MTRPLTIAITGVNSGIGLRAARQLALEGHKVIALCRNPARGTTALQQINQNVEHPARLVPIDLADLESVRTSAATIQHEFAHLDALINNAALFDQTRRQPDPSRDGHELIWATNHLGPFLLTALLSPCWLPRPPPPRHDRQQGADHLPTPPHPVPGARLAGYRRVVHPGQGLLPRQTGPAHDQLQPG